MTARGLAVALLVVLAACDGASAPPAVPSELEARAYLDTVVTRVASGDAAGICELGSGTCAQILRRADPSRVPTTAPIVVGTRVIEPARAGDGWSLGGRVLELCGRDGLDEPYYSEMLVFRDGPRLISTATPYWLGIGIADSPMTREGPPANKCP